MSTQELQVYYCEICGNLVEVFKPGVGALVCCGVSMVLKAENTVDAAVEKHVPVIEKVDGGTKIVVGSTAHPMGDDHFIEWIELIAGSRVCRMRLKPGDAPEAFFPVDCDDAIARAYCNLHGLWKSN